MKMAESSSKGRKHFGKRRNCSLRAISPFLTVFSKDLYCRHVKSRACWERINDSWKKNTFDKKKKNIREKGASASNKHLLFNPKKDKIHVNSNTEFVVCELSHRDKSQNCRLEKR